MCQKKGGLHPAAIPDIPAWRLCHYWIHTVMSNPPQAVSPKVAPLRINLKALILLQAKISPCGRDDIFF